MAVEARRGCGYRKVGGLYLMGHGSGVPCDRLPLPLTVCPCCGAGIKQARGFTWVDVNALVGGVHRNCRDEFPCPLCMATSGMGRAGLIWIGEKFYSTPGEFVREADQQGISRRVAAVPRGFKVGETWILLAHPKGAPCGQCAGAGLIGRGLDSSPCDQCAGSGKVPAIFRVFRPYAVEKIVTATQARDEAAMDELRKKGITPVIVPDDDPDHRGTVYDDDQGDEPKGGAQ